MAIYYRMSMHHSHKQSRRKYKKQVGITNAFRVPWPRFSKGRLKNLTKIGILSNILCVG
jgi:hypothetical protein